MLYAIGFYGGLAAIIATLYHFFPQTVSGIFQFIVHLFWVCISSAWAFLTMLAELLP